MELTKPSLTRLARKAGVKSVSEECFPYIRAIITRKLNQVITQALIVNSEHQTKTLMIDDVYDALELCGENVTKSTNIGTSTITK